MPKAPNAPCLPACAQCHCSIPMTLHGLCVFGTLECRREKAASAVRAALCCWPCCKIDLGMAQWRSAASVLVKTRTLKGEIIYARKGEGTKGLQNELDQLCDQLAANFAERSISLAEIATVTAAWHVKLENGIV